MTDYDSEPGCSEFAQLSVRVKSFGVVLWQIRKTLDLVEDAVDDASVHCVLVQLRSFVRDCESLLDEARALRDDLGRGAEMTKGK